MADELKTVLGFEAGNAISTIKALTKALNGYSNAISKAASSTKSFNDSSKGIEASLNSAARANERLAQSVKKSSDAEKERDGIVKRTKDTYGKTSSRLPSNYYKSISTAQNETINNTKKYNDVVKQSVLSYGKTFSRVPTNHYAKIRAEAEKTAGAVKKSSGDMILSWKSVIRIFTIQLIHQAISKVTSAFVEGAKAARSYEISLAEIQTISGKSYKNFEDLAKRTEEFAAITGQPLPAVTEGIYQTLSNQVVDTADAFKFLGTASDFSIAAVTDLGSSVNLLSSVLNSYQLSSSQADQVAGKLFKTIELGRIRGQEFADTFGRVLVLSAQLGVELDEVFASMATLTRAGIQYNEAYTLLTNVQLKLIKPTKELKEVFADLGIASAEAGIQAYGLQGLLQKIEQAAGGTASELGEVFGRVRAIRGALGLGKTVAEQYADSLERIKKAGASDLAQAKGIVFNTNAKQVALELNKLDIAMTKFGRNTNNALLDVFNSFGGATGAIKAFTISLSLAGAAWLIVRKYADGSLAAMTKGFKNALSSGETFKASIKSLAKSPFAWAAAIGAASVLIQGYFNKNAKAAREYRDELEKTLEVSRKLGLIKYEAQLEEQRKGNNKLLSTLQKFLINRQRLFGQSDKDIQQIEQILYSSLEDQASGHLSAISGLFGSFDKFANNAVNKLKEINDEAKNISGSISDFNFERQLKSVDKYHEVYQRIARAEALRSAAVRAANKGEKKLANTLQQRAEAQSKAALAAADQTKNASLIRKAEDDVETTLKNQYNLQEEAKKQIIEQSATIKKIAPDLKTIESRVKYLIDRFKDLKKKLATTFDPLKREKILKNLAGVSKDLEKEFGKVKVYAQLANATELKSEFQAATQGFFDPLTGQVKTFEQATKDSFKNIADALKDLQTQSKSDLQAIINALVGAASNKEQQKRLYELNKLQKTGNTATSEQVKNQKEIDDAIKLSVADIKHFKSELDDINKVPTFSRSRIDDYKKRLETTKLLKKAVTDAALEAQKLALSGKSLSPEYADAVEKLAKIREALVYAEEKTPTKFLGIGPSLKDASDQLKTLIDRLSEIPEKQKAIVEGQDNANLFKAASDKLLLNQSTIENYKPADTGLESKTNGQTDAIKQKSKEAGDALGKNISDGAKLGAIAIQQASQTEVISIDFTKQKAIDTGYSLNYNISQGATQAANNVEQASQSMINSLKRVEEQIARVNQAFSGNNSETATAYRGGLLYRNNGGFTPRGSDTIPAMLSPGEFVVNAASSRKFFSQLVAINNNKQPVYRASGGPVTNVGDVNISVNGASAPKETARAVAAELTRELRRNTSRI